MVLSGTVLILAALLQGSPPPPQALPSTPGGASSGSAPHEVSSVLGRMEREVMAVHRRLRPYLLRISMPVLVAPEGEGRPDHFEVVVSGVVLEEGGFFVAPGMVSDTDPEIRVRRFDGESFQAHLIAFDPVLGLSLFQAPGLDLPSPPLASADTLAVGSLVLSLGNSYGLDGSLSVGFLSGLQRNLGDLEGLFQITTPVNPGDGGGILADRHGRIVGILKTSLREVAAQHPGHPQAESMSHEEGLSFAIPVDRVLKRFSAHLTQLPARRHWLGVMVQEGLIPSDLRALGGGGSCCLTVLQVYPDSPAYQAGLRPGDVLLALGGVQLETLASLRAALAEPTERVRLRYLRARKPCSVQLELGWAPPQDQEERGQPPEGERGDGGGDGD